MNWDQYELYHPGVWAPLNTLPRAEARRAYDRLMQEKSNRIGILVRLAAANGVKVDNTDASIQNLNDWFRLSVQPDPDRPGFLLPDWYSVAGDLALFLGDVIIQRRPQLSWQFFTWGKKNNAYQKPVIMGFAADNPKYRTNMDVGQMLQFYGHRIVIAKGSIPYYGHVSIRGIDLDLDAISAKSFSNPVEEDAFVRWIEIACLSNDGDMDASG